MECQVKTRLTDFGLRWLNLALTARCNMRCLFCPINDFQYTTTEMDVGLAARMWSWIETSRVAEMSTAGVAGAMAATAIHLELAGGAIGWRTGHQEGSRTHDHH